MNNWSDFNTAGAQPALAPDLSQAQRFLDLLDPDATIWTFQTFDDNADRKDKSRARVFHGTLEQHADRLTELQSWGAGIFVTINETDGRGRKNGNIVRVRAAWLDLDGAPIDPVRAWETPHILVESSPDKWHPYWLVNGLALDKFQSVQSALIKKFNGDDVKDLARVMRLPGFYHQKVNAAKGQVGTPCMVKMHDTGAFPAAFTAAEFEAKLRPKLSERAAPIDTGATFTSGDGPSQDEVAEALTYIDPDLEYGEWASVLMAIHDQFGAAGLPLADDWSARGNKYQPGLVADKFKGFKPGGGVTIKTVFDMAKRNGADPAALARKHRGQTPGRAKGGGKRQDTPVISDLSEDGVALSFTKRYGDKLRFDHDQGRWFEWRGDRWKPDNTHLAYSYCRQIAREMSEELKEAQRPPFRKAAFAAGVERMARADRAHAVTSEGWDADPFMLGCPGVTIDLRTGKHMSPDPAHGITKQAAVRPVEGDCPLWRGFLSEVCEGDADMVRFLQQWAGYCLTGDTREHALLFVYGSGGNGKSVFLETVTHILGEYAATASMDTFTASKHSQHLTFMAMLRGARLVTASETEEGKAWAETKIKQVTGGDRITANFMRQDAFTFTPQFKLTVVGNHKPVLKNVDDAARRRFNIVPFTVKPRNPDRQLTAKLKAEAPAILQWMIAGCLDWQANGLVRPTRVLDATAEYFDDQDLFGQWLEEGCRVEPENRHLAESFKSLFASWTQYAQAAGESPGTQVALGNALTRRGLLRDRRLIAGKRERIWRGIQLHREETYQP